MSSNTWEELFRPFEGRNVIINADTNILVLKNILVYIKQIRVGDENLILDLNGNRQITFFSIYEPYLDDKDRLVCMNRKGESISIELSPVQLV